MWFSIGFPNKKPKAHLGYRHKWHWRSSSICLSSAQTSINPCCAEFTLRKEIIFTLSIIFLHQNGISVYFLVEEQCHCCQVSGCCFTNVLWALQTKHRKIYNARNHIYAGNFNLKLCMCVQSMSLSTCTKIQLEILIRSKISAKHKFQENILESSQNVSETIHEQLEFWSSPPRIFWFQQQMG